MSALPATVKPVRAPQPRGAGGRFIPRAQAEGGVPGMDAKHRAASYTDTVMAPWNPPLTDANTDWQWERTPAVARTRDLVENNEHAAAAVDRATAMQVGVQLRYSPRHEVMARRLGITVEQASDLATQIQNAWESWSQDPLFRCDWEGQQDFGGQVNLAARHKFVDGEAIGVMRWDGDGDLPYGWKWRTSLQLVDPDRLSNPMGQMNRPTLVNGVETDGRRPVAYHIREAHPADPAAWGQNLRWERVEARTEWGRPVVLHLYSKNRVGQRRGISKFVACLRAFRQFAGYKESELSSAALNSIFGAQIKTTKSAGDAAEALGVKAMTAQNEIRRAWYNGADPRLSNGARISVLAPGDELELNAVPRHVASFEGFTRVALQGIAAGLGLSGSQLTMDFSKTNFSSWRGEMLEVWRGVLQDRATITTQFANLALLCVVEEAIDNGDITPPAGCPDLYANTAGWLSGRWIGPSRGTIDPAGEVDGAVKRMAAGLSTHEDEALELGGNDYEAIAGQVQYERDLWADKGLTPTALREMLGMPMPGAAAPVPQDPQPNPENAAAGDQRAPAPAPQE